MLQCYEKEEIAQANVNLSFFGQKCSVAEMLRRMLIGHSRMMYMAWTLNFLRFKMGLGTDAFLAVRKIHWVSLSCFACESSILTSFLLVLTCFDRFEGVENGALIYDYFYDVQKSEWIPWLATESDGVEIGDRHMKQTWNKHVRYLNLWRLAIFSCVEIGLSTTMNSMDLSPGWRLYLPLKFLDQLGTKRLPPCHALRFAMLCVLHLHASTRDSFVDHGRLYFAWMCIKHIDHIEDPFCEQHNTEHCLS